MMILPNLMLQKPSAKSKSKDHSKALEDRLQKWKGGMIQQIWNDNKIIQHKLTSKPQRSSDDITRIFSKLMFEGKVTQALKFLDESASNSVLPSSSEVVEKLRSLHPDAQPILPESLLYGPMKPVSPVYFNNISEEEIFKAASKTKGAAGPSMFDAAQWKRILCSGQFKKEGKELREEIATFAKKIAIEIVDPATLEAYTACRLIPLDKSPGSS